MKTSFTAVSEPIKKLRLLKHFIPERTPYLAGGACRDDYMDKADEISDYDIFIEDVTSLFGEDNADTIEKILENVFPQHDDITQLFDSEYLTIQEQHDTWGDVKPGPNSQILGVWEVEEDYTQYQIIFTMEKPERHINQYFDIGFCKAFCDGKKIRYTDDFLRDAKNRTLTIVGDDMTKEQVEYAVDHHCDKIMWKYDRNFRIVVPARYQHFTNGQYPSI